MSEAGREPAALGEEEASVKVGADPAGRWAEPPDQLRPQSPRRGGPTSEQLGLCLTTP